MIHLCAEYGLGIVLALASGGDGPLAGLTDLPLGTAPVANEVLVAVSNESAADTAGQDPFAELTAMSEMDLQAHRGAQGQTINIGDVSTANGSNEGIITDNDLSNSLSGAISDITVRDNSGWVLVNANSGAGVNINTNIQTIVNYSNGQ